MSSRESAVLRRDRERPAQERVLLVVRVLGDERGQSSGSRTAKTARTSAVRIPGSKSSRSTSYASS